MGCLTKPKTVTENLITDKKEISSRKETEKVARAKRTRSWVIVY